MGYFHDLWSTFLFQGLHLKKVEFRKVTSEAWCRGKVAAWRRSGTRGGCLGRTRDKGY